MKSSVSNLANAVVDERLDLVVDLDDERIAWQPLHEALEELDAAGFYPHRFHQISEHEAARLDHELGSTLGAAMSLGGGWIIEHKTDRPMSPLAGCAGYHGGRDYGVAGPFSLEGGLLPFRLTMLLGTLFSLRERGYHQALIPNVKASALTQLAPLLGGAILSQRRRILGPPPRVVVCASGSGSNFQAVIDAIERNELRLDLVRLVVNRQSAFAAERAARAGIDTAKLIWNRTFEKRQAFDARVLDAVGEAAPDLVLLLGWMHLLPPPFVTTFPELLNIHPAYLPLHPATDTVVLPDGSEQAAFRGAHAVDDALAAQAAWIGASMHRVTDETDRGGILARAPLALIAGEERVSLDARLHQLEHRVVVDALSAWIAR